MEIDKTMQDTCANDDEWLPSEPMDRLFISAPQGPPRLPGPPTFGTDTSNRRCKHVHFQEAEVVSLIKAGSEMTAAERRELWYSADDLDGYKTQARTISRKLRQPEETETLSGSTNTNTLGSSDTIYGSVSPHSFESISTQRGGEEDDPDKKPAAVDGVSDVTCDGESRGLEHRVCLNRQRHKYLAIRCTLKAQMQSRCPDFIARISSKCTQWAKEIAVAEADRDFCEAYCPQRLITPKKLKNDCPIMNFFRRPPKRCLEGEQASESVPESENSDSLIGSLQPCVPTVPLCASSQEETKKSTCWIERCVRQKCCKDF
jgi:hypothetical protein